MLSETIRNNVHDAVIVNRFVHGYHTVAFVWFQYDNVLVFPKLHLVAY